MKTYFTRQKERDYSDPKKELIEIQQMFKMMGNDYRMRIMILLGQQDNLSLDQINEFVGGDFPNISSHTKKLESAGLLSKKYKNRFVLHSLTQNGKRALKALDQFNYSIE
jgi:DNA-binding MarR family transcriptional regulator